MDLFERLDRGQPPPAQLEKKDHQKRQDEEALFAAQRLLDWLQRWPKDIVRLSEIRIYGPKSIRDRKSAIRSAEILVKHGWLTRQPTRYYNARVWKITRKLVVGPTVAPESQSFPSLSSDFTARF